MNAKSKLEITTELFGGSGFGFIRGNHQNGAQISHVPRQLVVHFE